MNTIRTSTHASLQPSTPPSTPPPAYATPFENLTSIHSNRSHHSLHDLHEDNRHLGNVVWWAFQCEWRLTDAILANTTNMFVLLTRSPATGYLDEMMVTALFVTLPLFVHWVIASLRHNYRPWAPSIETQRSILWALLVLTWITYAFLLYYATWKRPSSGKILYPYCKINCNRQRTI